MRTSSCSGLPPPMSPTASAAPACSRSRGNRWYWTHRGRAPQAGLRGTGGAPVQDRGGGHRQARRHRGRALGPRAGALRCRLPAPGRDVPGHQARPGRAGGPRRRGRSRLRHLCARADRVEVGATAFTSRWGEAHVRFGDVRRDPTGRLVRPTPRETGQPIGEVPLDLPPRTLQTRAVWWTISPRQRAALAGRGVDLGGAAHAAEHASIGLLPLVAACDRWDVGGVSADLHPATGQLTVFVYDGHDGGAGFAERGFRAARDWLQATAEVIASCECAAGCPSCIQSPKCGNGNQPLSKPARSCCCNACWAAAGTAPSRHELSTTGAGKGATHLPFVSGHEATPAGGESGGRRTVRPRGGRAGPVTQESLRAASQSYQPVIEPFIKTQPRGMPLPPMLPDRGHFRRGKRSRPLPLSSISTRQSSRDRARWRSVPPSTGMG